MSGNRSVVGVFVVSIVLASGCGKKTGGDTPADAGAPRMARIAQVAPGDAPADLSRSTVQVAVIKDRDDKNPVVVHMTLADGSLSLSSATASAKIAVDLDSIETGMPIRNDHVRKLFFETGTPGWATMDVQVPAIPPDVVQALRGARHVERARLDATVRVHGHTLPLPLTVDARYADDGRLTVKTTAPVPVKISDLGMVDTLHKLSAVCMHDSIDDVVMVEADLRFEAPR